MLPWIFPIIKEEEEWENDCWITCIAINPGARNEINGTPRTFPLSVPIATDNTSRNNSDDINGEKIVLLAKRLLNTPYLWGGKSSFGIDCSGLTQLVFSLFNHHLPRNASHQIELGKDVSIKDAKPGDLAYFVSNSNKVTHVGIMIDNKTIIHASGSVRIDDINEKGILKEKEYTHQLYKIKRLI